MSHSPGLNGRLDPHVRVQLAGPASHGRAAPAILSCGHVEPVQAGRGRRKTRGAVPITPICVHRLTLP